VQLTSLKGRAAQLKATTTKGLQCPGGATMPGPGVPCMVRLDHPHFTTKPGRCCDLCLLPLRAAEQPLRTALFASQAQSNAHRPLARPAPELQHPGMQERRSSTQNPDSSINHHPPPINARVGGCTALAPGGLAGSNLPTSRNHPTSVQQCLFSFCPDPLVIVIFRNGQC
jgi:hypothetical protein